MAPDSGCFDSCYSNSNCILAYLEMPSLQCSLYDFLPRSIPITVVEAEPDEEKIIGFKTTLPEDTCPSTYENLTFTFTSNSGSQYSWTAANSSTWTFSACLTEWTRFDRTTVSVCMKGRNMGTTVTKLEAQEACTNISAVLIGVQSVEEAQWMSDEIKRVNGIDKTSFWIDGDRNCTDGGNRCDNYTWTNDLTTPSDVLKDSSIASISYGDANGWEPCLAAYYRFDEQFIINDVSRSFGRAKGAMCGYKLI